MSLPGLEGLECYRVEVADFVATVTLDRPPVNAQNGKFREETCLLFDVLHDSPEVRAVVLTGAGRTFSAGADLKERPGMARSAAPIRGTIAWSAPASTASSNATSRSSPR